MKKLLFAFLSMTFLFASCGKDGAVGPAGPQGATGPAGPTGPTGSQGNANVTATTINVAAWGIFGAAGNQWYATDFAVPSITQAIVDRGAVHVYYNPWVSEYIPLPFVTYPAGNIATITPFHYLGKIRLEAVCFDRRTPWNPGAMNFKVVVVAPSLRKMPKVDWNNYAEVAKTFNLPD